VLATTARADRCANVPIAPFVLNLQPSPAGDRFALAVAHPEGRSGVGVVVRSTIGDAIAEVAVIETLRPVVMTWDPLGQRLAFVADDIYGVWDGTDPVVPRTAPPSRALGFDMVGTLWGLSGERQWRASAEDGFAARYHADGVVAMCTWPVHATVLRRPGGLEVRYEHGGRPRSVLWPLSVASRPRIRGSQDGRSLFIGADCPSAPGRVRLELACIDVGTGRAERFFGGNLGTGIGWQEPAWAPWKDRSLLLASELHDCASVFVLHVDGSRVEQIGPQGFEVIEIAAAPQAGRVAMTGAPVRRRDCRDAWLVVCSDQGKGEWRTSRLRANVNVLPAWDQAGRTLFFVHSPSFPAWNVCSETEASLGKTSSESAELGEMPSPQGDFELPGPRTRSGALVYVAGPHRRFVDGTQSAFFHHALASLLRQFAAEGYTAVCLNPPGSTGRGRAYREPDAPWSLMARGALAAKVRELRDRGIERIGLLTGSLGALPTLHFLRTEALDAAVLVSPVYRCETPPLEGWQHLFDEATRATTTEGMAQAMRTPLLILHGLRDEMAASSQSSRFVMSLPAEVPCEYITLADEGHIFSQSASWHQTLAASTRFLREHLHHED